MNKKPTLLGPDGLPINPNMMGKRTRNMALNGGINIPYDAADMSGSHFSDWYPFLSSPDVELNPYRDIIVSRVRDLVRNDGWASGIVTRVLDNALGGVFRAISKPDYRALSVKTGYTFDAQWAAEWSREVDSHWRSWADDESRYCDSGRRLNFSQMMWVAMRHLLLDGDAIAIMNWIPERIENGKALYATAVQLVDPDRLSNPSNKFDIKNCRGGVELDDYEEAIGYHFRKAHISDWFSMAETVTWEYIPKETEWGRPNVVHYFESQRASEHRGGAGILTPIIQRLKMLTKYDSTEMDAAVVNAIFAAYLESPFDPVAAKDALDDFSDFDYQQNRAAFHDKKDLKMGGVRIPTLYPGEKISTIAAQHPNNNYAEFQKTALRNIAAGTGLSSQQVSNDWSDVNYSSARAAMLEAWKTLSRRRDNFARGFASPIRSAWLEECCYVEDLPWPSGVSKDFLEDSIPLLRTSISKCMWLGPGRGWIDPVAERQGSVLGMDAGLSTLEIESAENSGTDWEEIINQRKIEVDRFRKLGLPLPEWMGNQQQNATAISRPPTKPEA